MVRPAGSSPRRSLAIAGEGVVLTDYHVFKVCSPTRGSFMTGLLSYHHGVTGVLHYVSATPREFQWLPEQLRATAGYDGRQAPHGVLCPRVPPDLAGVRGLL